MTWMFGDCVTSSVRVLLFIVTATLQYVVTSQAPRSDYVITSCCRFNYLQNVDDICTIDKQSPELLAVIVVCSAVENIARRQAIRSTWGSPDHLDGLGLRVVYVLGRAEGRDANVQVETRRYGDVVQADFVDSYSNLSVKSLAALDWAAEHAACAHFLVKTDDDTFINTHLLSHDLSTTAHRRFVMGHVIAGAQPVRTPGAKWFTPRSLYAGDTYPTYASGAAYVISGDGIRPLLRAAEGTSRVFWIEDVYVTGMLARAAGLQLIVNGKFDGSRAMPDDCAVRAHIALHRTSSEQMHKLWAIVTADKARIRCYPQSQTPLK